MWYRPRSATGQEQKSFVPESAIRRHPRELAQSELKLLVISIQSRGPYLQVPNQAVTAAIRLLAARRSYRQLNALRAILGTVGPKSSAELARAAASAALIQ